MPPSSSTSRTKFTGNITLVVQLVVVIRLQSESLFEVVLLLGLPLVRLSVIVVVVVIVLNLN